ncbi:DUF4158 domain-containing protein [Nonomuraea sp. NPDC046570]|uniref:DUF4158 domain-containing protein n=1 Tax=Nonomuraea sp. NPDC046570 TaxID=3155255 RepID=UPI0033C3D52C
MFSREQLEQLRSFPDIGRDELITHFTLTPADMAFVDPGRGRGPADRLGMAVMVATLPLVLLLTAAVHPAGAGSDRLPRRAGHGRADAGGGDVEGVEPYGRS